MNVNTDSFAKYIRVDEYVYTHHYDMSKEIPENSPMGNSFSIDFPGFFPKPGEIYEVDLRYEVLTHARAYDGGLITAVEYTENASFNMFLAKDYYKDSDEWEWSLRIPLFNDRSRAAFSMRDNIVFTGYSIGFTELEFFGTYGRNGADHPYDRVIDADPTKIIVFPHLNGIDTPEGHLVFRFHAEILTIKADAMRADGVFGVKK